MSEYDQRFGILKEGTLCEFVVEGDTVMVVRAVNAFFLRLDSYGDGIAHLRSGLNSINAVEHKDGTDTNQFLLLDPNIMVKVLPE